MPHALRVALIGHGSVGQTVHAPLISSTHDLVLSLVGSRQIEAVQQRWPQARVCADYLAAATDAEVDLVVIATPNDSHYPLAAAALLAGKHVVIDKPFTVTLQEAHDLVQLARQRGRLLSVFHNRRWDGDFLSLRQAVGSGALGDVRELVSRFDRFEPTPRDRWRERPGPGAGLWYDLGPHLIDQALVLFGAPETVTADLACLRDGAESTDYAQVVLGYPQRRVTLHCSRLNAWTAARFEAHGTAGSFVSQGLDVQEGQLKAGMAPGAPGWGVDARPTLLQRGGQAVEEHARLAGDYRQYYLGVRDAILYGSANPVPAGEALQVMAVLDCALRSAEQGRTLRFEPVLAP